ncbi:hypothetical protein VHEMI09552 [[Torrubiella] hemipterigena]|uniref:DUF2293 domain-containing protein n=1 Tax=[Torrubiella] hemipterigena TaxID=1531966 RepID=A0A0A1TQ88_9HYPO|nr:hypothetical protein VHEMI09552 [[Torrubiella] hemipterigena]
MRCKKAKQQRKTITSKKTLYIVKDKSRIQGLRAPKYILAQVFAEEKQTRSQRQAQVRRKDGTATDSFLKAIQAQFPKIPAPEAEIVASKATKKRSGRVGRTGTLDMDTKVRLAVAAHIRHCHTGYDVMMERGDTREESRAAVQQTILDKLNEWRGKANFTAQKDQRNRTSRLSKSTGRTTTTRIKTRAAGYQDRQPSPEVISLLSSDESEAKSPERLDLDTLSDFFATDDEDEDEVDDEGTGSDVMLDSL